MPVVVTDVQTELYNRGFPSYLITITEVTAACDAAVREMQQYTVMRGFSTFNCVIDQQNYYIFDPTKAEGVCQNAINVANVWWNPSGDFSSPDIFSPGFQLFTTVVIFGTNTFDLPSDMEILRGKLDSWSRQFGQQGFDLYGQCGDPAAYITLSPVPRADETTVVVEWDRPYGLSDVTSLSTGWGRKLMQWIEYKAAETCCRKYAETAGVEISGFKDAGKALAYWQTERDRLYKLTVGTQGGLTQGIVARS